MCCSVLIREREGVAATVLMNLGADLGQVHQRVEEAVRKGKATIALGELPYTSRAKKVLEFALAEARELNHSYVGTEHLLLGLLREEKGIAAQVLNSMNVRLDRARAECLRVLGSEMSSDVGGGPAGAGGRQAGQEVQDSRTRSFLPRALPTWPATASSTRPSDVASRSSGSWRFSAGAARRTTRS